MSIFKKKRDDSVGASEEQSPEDDLAPDLEESSAEDAVLEDPRANGPWDVTEVDGRDGRMDLGALWFRGVPGLELRLEVDKDSQQVAAATAVLGESGLQVQAFAAPRSGGLWDEIRAEIAASVERQGGTADEDHGPLGTVLRTRMPSAGPDNRTVFAPATFVGIDGPRWFLRGVLSGRAAIDEAAAEALLDVFRAIVVVRGGDPMAPRELLALSLPRDAEPTAAADADADADDDGAADTELNPFERGPEITEVR
ncbi:MAG: DUF3710 domain-containing protein [Ornithinibacter sp.]